MWWRVWGTSSAQLIANLQIKHSPHPAPMFCTHYTCVHSICIHTCVYIYNIQNTIQSAFENMKICLIMLKPQSGTTREICKKISTFQYWGPMLWALQKDCFRKMNFDWKVEATFGSNWFQVWSMWRIWIFFWQSEHRHPSSLQLHNWHYITSLCWQKHQ